MVSVSLSFPSFSPILPPSGLRACLGGRAICGHACRMLACYCGLIACFLGAGEQEGCGLM